ncbi:adenosylcobinamide-phosphate synthase CbiB [Zhongshania aquimaris]|uniref:Cobalamin biosynthesis protein CobD n=1 Tax=Zhongshania aquimaris TaxID=2857107 RepID=A0ABS6VTK9_9GAMM|nr:adenosylcobinamide-phosphate synthase CbiB [Zhongshania aquimaris]
MSSAMYIAMVWFSALCLDRVFGEPRRFHPLVGFGYLAKWVELGLNRVNSDLLKRGLGVFAWSILVLPPVILVCLFRDYLQQFSAPLVFLVDSLVLYSAIGWRSLCEHIRPVDRALAADDLAEARLKISYLVSRDTAELNSDQILSAGLETSLENSSDALFGSMLWYVLAGPAGVVLHRLANTLDAMWGYKNARYRYFGWWAARSDDVLNFIPAQLTSFGFSVLALSKRGFRCWFSQGWRWKSINAGAVMASGAAALNINLGGVATYHGETTERPILGCGVAPKAGDLERSIVLINKQLLLWLVVMALVGGLL